MSPVRFEHIPELGLSRNEYFSAEKLSELLEEPGHELMFRALAPATIHFHLERKALDALVTGQAEFAFTHPCVRCLEEVSISFQLNFETEIKTPELIDLEELLREELFLELPTYPACEPACA